MREPDPVRDRSPAAVVAFSRYLRWFAARDFHALRVAGTVPAEAGRPLVIYTNHPSWWDPALFLLLTAALLPGRPCYGPMDAAALAGYPFFHRIGVFGIGPGARGATRFLRSSLHILQTPAAMLWITAEGGFADARVRPVRLRPGVAHLARRAPQAIVMPLALEYPFWNERRPEALARFGDAVPPPADGSLAGWESALTAALQDTMDRLAVDSMARDPGRFRTVLTGATGIGGIYDLYRRLRAAVTGQRFDPSHGGPA